MGHCGRRNERGVALAVALFALVVIGALVAGNFFAGMLEQQAGQHTLFGAQAFEAAEAGLTDVIATAIPSGLETLPVGGPPLDLGALAAGDGASVSRQVTRLTTTLFLIRATGVRRNSAGAALATRSLGLLTRLTTPSSSDPAQRLAPLGERAWVPWY